MWLCSVVFPCLSCFQTVLSIWQFPSSNTSLCTLDISSDFSKNSFKDFLLNPNGNVCLLYFPNIRQIIHKLGKCNKKCGEIEKGKKLKNKRNYLEIYEYNMCLSSLIFFFISYLITITKHHTQDIYFCRYIYLDEFPYRSSISH